MNFLEFRNKMFELACFSINQVYAWQPGFDRNNLSRWTKNGLLIRLRQGYFTFPEYGAKRDYNYLFANRIYRPSYISLHTVLAFYGMIPEAVMQITSVTSLKTAIFNNKLGEYSYKSVSAEFMFGYELRPMESGLTIRFASPEKALLDLLYLYPAYKTQKEIKDLRLDEDFMSERLNKTLLLDYTSKFKNKALDKRVKILLGVSGL